MGINLENNEHSIKVYTHITIYVCVCTQTHTPHTYINTRIYNKNFRIKESKDRYVYIHMYVYITYYFLYYSFISINCLFQIYTLVLLRKRLKKDVTVSSVSSICLIYKLSIPSTGSFYSVESRFRPDNSHQGTNPFGSLHCVSYTYRPIYGDF